MGLIDFKEIKRLVSVWEVLDLVGWQWRTSTGTERRGPCLLHGSTSERSRVFACSRQGWTCFKCKRSGDVVRLWSELRGLAAYPAALDLCKRLGLAVPYLPQRTLF